MVNKNESDLEKGVGIPQSEIRIPQSNALRILLLEDSQTDAELNERELRKAGIEFDSLRVDTRDTFIRALEEFRPDVILSDYKLPDFDGMAALEIVRRDHPEVPVIMVTGALSDIDSVELIHVGARDYVLKDRLARLATAVQRALSVEQGIRARKIAEERFRKISESAQDAIIMMGTDQCISFWNAAAARIFGYTAAEAMGQELHALIVPAPAHAKFSKAFPHFQATGEGTLVGKVNEVTALRKSGEEFPAELSISATQFGGQWHAIGIVRDITERKQAEAKIMETQAELQRLLDAANQSRRALLSVVQDQKRAEEKIKVEIEVTSHLLMIAEATAHTTDIDRLMEQVVHCGQKIMRCDICLSYLWDNESKEFRPCKAYGLEHGLIPVFMTETMDEKVGFVKEALGKNEPVVEYVGVGLAPARKGQPQGSPLHWIGEISTLAIIPLIGKTDPLGLIVGIYSKPHKTAERDREVMKGISNQVSVSLEQAIYYKESVDKTLELSHKIETIKVMSQIDRSILSTLKADELLETVTRLISKVISCERATVSLVDMERGGFIYKAGYGTLAVPKGGFVPFTDTSTRGIIETGRMECVNNLTEMRPLLPLEKRFLDEGFLSHIRVPITIKGDVAGILTVGAKRVAAFTKENLSTLEYLCSQIGVALSNAGLIADLEELFISVVKSLSSAIDAKSPWTAGHSERVTKYALDIARHMGLPEKELKDLELAGLLHDVGKIGTYESILDKPGKLTDEELVIMRQHPAKGAEILAPIKQLKDIIPGVKYHHEFYDGTGYPEGLKGEAIPLHARILTVADTVDAMGANRPYREGRGMDVIIAELKRCSGTQFDLKVVEAFLKIFPQ